MRKIIPIGIIFIGLGLVAFSFLPTNTTTPSRKAETPLLGKGGEENSTPLQEKANPLPQAQSAVFKKIISPEVKTISVSLVVRNSTSTLQIPEGSSVYEAMSVLSSTTAFRFHSTYYSGMGYFIDEIKGEKNRNNAFWVYYVNGAQANVGAGEYILKNGDTVRWRLEDSAKKEVGIQ